MMVVYGCLNFYQPNTSHWVLRVSLGFSIIYIAMMIITILLIVFAANMPKEMLAD